MRSLIYFFKESLHGFTRNLSTTLGSIVTIFLSLLIIGIFLVAGNIVQNVMTSVEDEVSITAYVSGDASEADIDSLMNTIRTMEGVASVQFTTKEQALQNFRDMTTNPEIIDQLDGQNPLPASVDVELSDPQLVESVAREIANNSVYQRIYDETEDSAAEAINYGQQTVEKLFTMTNYVRYIGIALIALLIFIAMVFINNTIRLAILARRKEIAIMRLVGASNGFIRGPFLMEGALHAVIGAFLAVGVVELLRRFALPRVQDAFMWLPVGLDDTVYLLIYLALIGAGLIIGLLGSALAMRRYLKV